MNAVSMHTAPRSGRRSRQASGRCPSHRLFKTFVHVVEPVKSPYNAVVRRELGRTRAQPARYRRSRFPVRSAAKTVLPARRNGTSQMTSLDSFKCARTLKVGTKSYIYYSLPVAEKNGLKGISRLPFSMKVLLENLLRNEDGRSVSKEDIQACAQWLKTKTSEREIAFRPARVLMQDFTGVPAVVDLAAMRDAMKHLGGDPKRINPLVPVDLVIDHSVAITFFGDNAAFGKNVAEEYKQNAERYRFLKWAQGSFEGFRVVPPGTGICHQVNLEYLSQTVFTAKGSAKIDGKTVTGDSGLSGHGGRHRFPHHHGQRPRRARLGRRRHRGGSRDARPALFDGPAGGDRRQALGQAQGRRHRDRPRADGDADAAQARRGRQVRRVLRPRPRRPAPSPTAPRSATCRRNTAPPADSSP